MRAGAYSTEQILKEGRPTGSLPFLVHCVDVDLLAQGFSKDNYQEVSKQTHTPTTTKYS